MKQPIQRVKFDDEARDKISVGINLLADAVQVTLGPGGRHVAFEPGPGTFAVTKDGVTVAKSIRKLKDPFENIGAQMVRQAAQRTAEVAGDGTTTATILARAIFNEGKKVIASGANVVEVRKGIEKAVAKVVDFIGDNSRPCKTKKDLKYVATISANSDKKLGGLIAEAKHKLGKDASITVEMSRQAESSVEYVDGLSYDEGYASPYFVTNQRSMRVEFENPFIMVVGYRMRVIHDMTKILEEVSKTGRPVLILFNSYDAEVVEVLAYNNMQQTVKCCATNFPLGFDEDGTELAKDIAALTGATVLGGSTGVDARKAELKHLGQAKRVVVTRHRTMIVGGAGKKEDIKTRISQLKDFLERSINTPVYDQLKVYINSRVAKLSGGIAVIRAGGATEMETREARDRIEDAVFAVEAAAEDGIVPGGGSMYVRAASKLADMSGANSAEKLGIQIVRRALLAPLAQIAKNAGHEPTLILEKTKENPYIETGFNASKGEFENLLTAGIIDPAKVAKEALKNASSVATLLLTTEAVIVTDYDEEEK